MASLIVAAGIRRGDFHRGQRGVRVPRDEGLELAVVVDAHADAERAIDIRIEPLPEVGRRAVMMSP
jgi:hypothetical protein